VKLPGADPAAPLDSLVPRIVRGTESLSPHPNANFIESSPDPDAVLIKLLEFCIRRKSVFQ